MTYLPCQLFGYLCTEVWMAYPYNDSWIMVLPHNMEQLEKLHLWARLYPKSRWPMRWCTSPLHTTLPTDGRIAICLFYLLRINNRGTGASSRWPCVCSSSKLTVKTLTSPWHVKQISICFTLQHLLHKGVSLMIMESSREHFGVSREYFHIQTK